MPFFPMRWLLALMLFGPAVLVIEGCASTHSSASPEFLPVEVDSNGRVQGRIVPGDYDLIVQIDDLEDRFTPSVDEVHLAEERLHKEYEDVYGAEPGRPQIADLRSHDRQYVGYINANGEKVILILMLDRSSQEGRREFRGWERDVIVGSGPFFEEHLRFFKVNLGQNRLVRY